MCGVTEPLRERRVGEQRATAAPKARRSFGSLMSSPSVPSWIWSWMPPTAVATTGRDFHMASATVSPKPSARLF